MYSFQMRAFICFQKNDGWFFHLLSEDGQKPLTKWRPIESEEVLLAMIAKMHGDLAEAKNDIRRWSRGTVAVDLSPAQCRFLGIRSARSQVACSSRARPNNR
jgi:hypothetical protein